MAALQHNQGSGRAGDPSSAGRENVIAGVDCGFGTFVVQSPEIAWLKLESLVEGARLASEELW